MRECQLCNTPSRGTMCLRCWNEARGRRWRQVALRLASGRFPKQVAQELGISVKTVEFHWGVIKQKLGVSSYQELTLQMVRNGQLLVPVEERAFALDDGMGWI